MKDLMNIYKRSDQMLFRKHCLDFFLCNVVWSNGAMLSVVCEMEPLGQYCISFSCTMLSHEYEENFAQDFAQDFSCAMLSGASRTTLHWVLTCAMLPQSIKTTLNKIFSCALLSGASSSTLHRVLTYVMLS